MAITQDEHNELLAQIDELNGKLLTAEGQKETAEAELETYEESRKTIDGMHDDLRCGVRRVIASLEDLL